MANISGTERIQWTIEGQRFEQVTGFVVHESKFFETWFENYDGSSFDGEGKAFEVTNDLVAQLNENSHIASSSAPNGGEEGKMGYVVRTENSGGKKSFFFDFRKIPKLEAEWMGAIMVYLRRGRVTFKWEEMQYEQQQCFSRLVVFFGINKMMETYGKPSKPRPTTTTGGATTSAAQAMSGLLPEGADQASRLAMAQVTLENYREDPSASAGPRDEEDGLTVASTTTGGGDSVRKEGVSGAGGDDTSTNGGDIDQETEEIRRRLQEVQEAVRPIHPSVDDEELTLPTVACYFCGSSGAHSTDDCPFKPKPKQ